MRTEDDRGELTVPWRLLCPGSTDLLEQSERASRGIRIQQAKHRECGRGVMGEHPGVRGATRKLHAVTVREQLLGYATPELWIGLDKEDRVCR